MHSMTTKRMAKAKAMTTDVTEMARTTGTGTAMVMVA